MVVFEFFMMFVVFVVVQFVVMQGFQLGQIKNFVIFGDFYIDVVSLQNYVYISVYLIYLVVVLNWGWWYSVVCLCCNVW